MQSIKVDKKELITILENNLNKHIDEYNEAVDGYHDEVTKALTEALSKAIDGEAYITRIDLNKPVSNTESYETIIGMLKLDTTDIIELSEYEYKQYVQDNWDWSRHTKAINATYLNKM